MHRANELIGIRAKKADQFKQHVTIMKLFFKFRIKSRSLKNCKNILKQIMC